MQNQNHHQRNQEPPSLSTKMHNHQQRHQQPPSLSSKMQHHQQHSHEPPSLSKMQHHQQHTQEPSPLARKPPRPPPISVSHPPNPNPTTRPDSKTLSYDSNSESTHSPIRSNSPENHPPPPPPPPPPPAAAAASSPTSKNAGAIVAVEKYYSPLTSPLPVTPPNNLPPPHQIVAFNAKEEREKVGGERKRKVRFGYGGGEGNIGRLSEKEGGIKKAALGIRVLELAFCLVSFSVMATDKTQGWSGDSFGRYKEYRFCLTVNIIGFVYAGFQAFDLAYHLATAKHAINHHLRYQFDFIMDQIIAYLLMSASSAAATRVVDWELNWGKDDFTKKASASVSMAFLAFLGFAMSSLISGYNLCNRDIC